MKYFNAVIVILCTALVGGASRTLLASDETDRLEAARESLQEILAIPD
jgi:hypothetical protein